MLQIRHGAQHPCWFPLCRLWCLGNQSLSPAYLCPGKLCSMIQWLADDEHSFHLDCCHHRTVLPISIVLPSQVAYTNECSQNKKGPVMRNFYFYFHILISIESCCYQIILPNKLSALKIYPTPWIEEFEEYSFNRE